MSFWFLIFLIYIFSQKISSIRSKKTKTSKLSDIILMTSESDYNEPERAEERIHEEIRKISKSNSSLEFVHSSEYWQKPPTHWGKIFFSNLAFDIFFLRVLTTLNENLLHSHSIFGWTLIISLMLSACLRGHLIQGTL